jgi:acyl-coenzyme A thioesterase PaaI-like protein
MTNCVPDNCVPIEPFPRLASSGVYVSRDPDTNRLRVRYFHRTTDNALIATVWFGPGTEGPPGHAHGGSVASVLDEAMGAAAWHAGHPVVAARLTVDFREMVPLNAEAIAEARIERIDGRKVRTQGRLVSQSGVVFAESHGLFIILEEEQLQRLGEVESRK